MINDVIAMVWVLLIVDLLLILTNLLLYFDKIKTLNSVPASQRRITSNNEHLN